MYLFKDKITYKPPGAQGILPHTDDAFFKYPTLVGMLAVDPCHSENGYLQLLLPKENDKETMTGFPKGLDYEKTLEEIAQLENKEWKWKGVDLEGGDMVWFPGRWYHRALNNISSSKGRTAIFLNYTDYSDDLYHDHFFNFPYRKTVQKNFETLKS